MDLEKSRGSTFGAKIVGNPTIVGEITSLIFSEMRYMYILILSTDFARFIEIFFSLDHHAKPYMSMGWAGAKTDDVLHAV